MTLSFDWIPKAGDVIDVLCLGRSGDSICGQTLGVPRKVLIRTGWSVLRPVEGEVFTVAVTHRTREGLFWVLEGQVRDARLDLDSLSLEPLRLRPREIHGDQTPQGELHFELENLIPRVPGFPACDENAIREIAAFRDGGDLDLAELLAGELLSRDLRCLEAHALLASFFLEGPLELRWTERALRHFRVGVAIGNLSIPDNFTGRLPWSFRGNRPYLHCLYGYARALERTGEEEEAASVFRRLVSLAPENPLEDKGSTPTN